MRQIFYLVRQNLKRKPFRTWLMIGGIFLACATLFTAAILSKGIQYTLQTAGERLGADIVAVPADAREEALSALISGSPSTFYMPLSLEEKVRKTRGVQQTCAQVYLRSLDAACCVVQVALVGFDPERDFTINPWVLQKTAEPLQNNQLIVGAKVISAVVGTPAKAIGQRLMFMGKPFTVATILEPTGLGTDYTVFLTMDMAYRMTEESPLYPVPVKRDQISTILVKVDAGTDPALVAQSIEQNIPELKAVTANQLTRSFSRQLQNLVDALFVAGGIFSLLALILAGNLFALSVRQRMRELGLFRAMGAGRSLVFKLIVLEAVCIAGIGGFFGILAGFAAVYFGKDIITDMIGNLYMWPDTGYFLQTALTGMAASLLAGILGGLYPACRISGCEPYEAIRRGE
ncbi:MAG: ABC transporter permease [Deltaproteobacteria bacterium]|jgi:putative ABC transport system permease protein|nr:ABC transporter permease [Deltaproteobacteria bacterium]